MKKWKTLSSLVSYENPYFKVWADKVKVDFRLRGNDKKEGGNDGLEVDYYFIERNNFSVAVPVIGDSFVMVKQYRYAIKQESLEFPMGGCEEGEDYIDCAQRELLEEGGCTAKKMTDLGEVAPTPGHSCQRYHTFLAEEVEEVGHQNRDDLEEDMEIHKIKISDFPKLVKSGQILDGPTLAAYAQYLIHQSVVQSPESKVYNKQSH
jgi:8-oxo-dGTP pyrophosphatase MutT (NUDIX family)